MKPIPLRLLPDTMTVRVPIDGDYGGEFAKPIEVKHVRFDRAAKLLRKRYQIDEDSRGLVFVDAVNSVGAFDVPVGSVITINGDEMSVVSNTAYKPYEVIHHWEIEVR